METIVQVTGKTPNWETLLIYERIERLVRQAPCMYTLFRVLLPLCRDLQIDTLYSFHIAALSPTELDEHIAIYSEALRVNAPSLPRYWSPWNVDESEMWGKTTPAIVHALINHYGCVMLLYSLKAPTDMEARTKVIGAARTLAEFGIAIRGKNGLKRVHAVLLLVVNASAIDRFPSADFRALLSFRTAAPHQRRSCFCIVHRDPRSES